MKKVLAVVAGVGCLAAATAAFAGLGAATGVNGSLHDMTRVAPSTADAMGRVCVYCHAPHHAIVDANGKNTAGGDFLPLWNHDISTTGFTPYTWATPANMSATITDVLAGPSRLCMSCHDGATAIDQHSDGGSFGQMNVAGTGTTLGEYISTNHDKGQRANLTTDLSNTHPIGFDYDVIADKRNKAALQGAKNAAGELIDGSEIVVSSRGYAIGITINDQQGTYNTVIRQTGGKTIKDNLYQGKIMTCATCHEVHNKENSTQLPYATTAGALIDVSPESTKVLGELQPAPNYFLYAKQYQSLICLSCHVK